MISLDGVIQAPGGSKEDESGNFNYGGWTEQYSDEVYGKVVQNELKQPTDYLLGRKTFEIWENYWPHHTDYWPGINEGTKFVLSTTRNETKWKNTVFVKTAEDIIRVKSEKGPDIQVWGSSELVPLLLKNDLVDELRLKIHPLLLGNGKKLFGNEIPLTKFKLLENTLTSTGVIIAHYKQAEK